MMKVVKFVQENCTPCKMLNQTLQAMEKEVDEVVTISDANRDDIKNRFNVMSTPTMIAFDSDVNVKYDSAEQLKVSEISRVSGVGFGKINDFFEEVE